MKDKPIYVSFANSRLEEKFEKLKEGKFEDKQLHQSIQRAIEDLKKNPMCGIKIPKKLWPKTYIQEYKIANLWKENLDTK